MLSNHLRSYKTGRCAAAGSLRPIREKRPARKCRSYNRRPDLLIAGQPFAMARALVGTGEASAVCGDIYGILLFRFRTAGLTGPLDAANYISGFSRLNDRRLCRGGKHCAGSLNSSDDDDYSHTPIDFPSRGCQR